MKNKNAINLYSSDHNADPLAQAFDATSKFRTMKNFGRSGNNDIMPTNVMAETVRFDGKYSASVRLGILISGAVLTWASLFAVARLILN